ncbi:VTT domain-containing protein [Paenibacillus sp. JX-17]|uniref:TVP38/TMEM64 family membrane protein n=1 Tax=Paenibacillus lacisoli TaxID=3064525 RepID=A0ABT9CJD7_9BACL|nr:VTT domain-containing protein [Paenibacillus sp. JX-17]MDO7907781.1 VTT domain-containing protein [Paenibacillus sp. JX-17]
MTELRDWIIYWLELYGPAGYVLSIGINVVISLLGVVPSVFLTAANLAVFGLAEGMILSWAGEAIGAVVSFVLYRKGLRRAADHRVLHLNWIQRLLDAEGKESFMLILALRFLPFVPSGVITLIAALGRTSLPVFVTASSLGKIPAILIEGYSVYQMLKWGWQGKLLLSLAAVLMIVLLFRKRSVPKQNNNPQSGSG